MGERGPGELPSVESGGFLMFRLKGTVLLAIWWQLLFVILYTAGIVALKLYVPQIRMDFPATLISVLGVVTGLLLVFRTNTAYDRYWEGRRLWSTMTVCLRTMTRGIWLGIKEESGKDLIEKKSALNLLVAFVIATKHYLREEYSYEYEDVQELISHLPRFATPSSNRPLSAQSKAKKAVVTKFEAHDFIAPTNIPIEISYYISGYLRNVSARGLVDAPTLGSMQAALGQLVECLTAFERILRTPIPLAYSVHLHHSVWLYILALPYQLVGQLDWWTIPSVGLAGYSLLGILGIGWEIENPFGYDENDLPLDDFCEVIRREIDMITRSRLATTDEWIFSPENHPLAPDNMLTAAELSTKSLDELHRMIRRARTETMEEEISYQNQGRIHVPKKSKRKSSSKSVAEDEEALIKLVGESVSRLK
jgi:putative membrane protein